MGPACGNRRVVVVFEPPSNAARVEAVDALIMFKSAKLDLTTRHIPKLASTLRIFGCASASERSDGSARIIWAYFVT
jgi:hypothetical protein